MDIRPVVLPVEIRSIERSQKDVGLAFAFGASEREVWSSDFRTDSSQTGAAHITHRQFRKAS
jgi:hypothetical protein